MSEQLLPCPCCGATAKQIADACGCRIECPWCHLTTPIEVYAAAARCIWNQRVIPDGQVLVPRELLDRLNAAVSSKDSVAASIAISELRALLQR